MVFPTKLVYYVVFFFLNINLLSSRYQLNNANMVVDDAHRMAGAPVAVQLVGPRLGDEQLLKDVELIDSVLKS